MATSVWKGYLTFGLISIPFGFSLPRGPSDRLTSSQRVQDRIRMRFTARIAEASAATRSSKLRVRKGPIRPFDEAELDKIEPQSARAMEIPNS